MTAKELIHAELEKIDEADLSALYQVIKDFAAARTSPPRLEGALAKLKRIKISAPEDFAADLALLRDERDGSS